QYHMLPDPGMRVVFAFTADDQIPARILNDNAVMGQVFLGRSRADDMDLRRSRTRADFYFPIYSGYFHPGASGQVVALIGFIFEGPSIVALAASGRDLQRVRRNRKHKGGGNKKPN